MPRLAFGRRAIWVLAALLPALQACYEFTPVDSQAATMPAGQYVELQISDRGRVGLGDRLGPGVREVSGNIASLTASEIVLSVDRVTNIDGVTTRWAGDTTHINRDFIATASQRRVSAWKTAALITAVAAVIGVSAGSSLIGGGSGKDQPDEPTTKPDQPPISVRIPRIVPIRP
jgi:hypothetical protein